MEILKKGFVMFALIIWCFTAQAALASEDFVHEDEATILNDLGLYHGVSTEEFVPDLGSVLNRETGIVMLIRLFGLEQDAESLTDEETDAILSNFTDADGVSGWARKSVAYAVENGLVVGMQPTLLGPREPLNGKMYCTLILRQLGYSPDYDEAAEELAEAGGITSEQAELYASNPLQKDDLVGISYGVLTVQYATGTPVIDSLISLGVVSEDAALDSGLIDESTSRLQTVSDSTSGGGGSSSGGGGGSPSPEPVSGSVSVQMYNDSIVEETHTINPRFKINNTGSSTLNLSDVKLRYYFTVDEETPQNFVCDYAECGASNITGAFVRLESPMQGANCYLEIGFTSGAGSLAAGASSEFHTRFYKTDWSNYSQTDDYSFNSSGKSYANWTKATGYVGGTLSWGEEPSTPLPSPTTTAVEAAEASISDLSSQALIDAAQVAYNDALVLVQALAEGEEKSNLTARLSVVQAVIEDAQATLDARVPSGELSSIAVLPGETGSKQATISITVLDENGMGLEGYSATDFTVYLHWLLEEVDFSSSWFSEFSDNGSGTYTVVFTGQEDNTEYYLQSIVLEGVELANMLCITTPVGVETMLDSINVTSLPIKTTYYVGESFDLAGLEVTGIYGDGSTVPLTITADNISGFDSSEPITGQTITVTYQQQTATFTVDILPPE